MSRRPHSYSRLEVEGRRALRQVQPVRRWVHATLAIDRTSCASKTNEPGIHGLDTRPRTLQSSASMGTPIVGQSEPDLAGDAAVSTAEAPATEARVEFVRFLRAEISELVKLQHQVAVIAGGSVAVAASLLGSDVDPPAWLLLGLSVLFLAFGFTMLEKDRLIVCAAEFILQSGTPEAVVQAEWERHLRDATRNVGTASTGIGAMLSSAAKYAIPVFGAVGASWAFLADDEAPDLMLLVPAVLMLAFVAELVSVTRNYLALPNIGSRDRRVR